MFELYVMFVYGGNTNERTESSVHEMYESPFETEEEAMEYGAEWLSEWGHEHDIVMLVAA